MKTHQRSRLNGRLTVSVRLCVLCAVSVGQRGESVSASSPFLAEPTVRPQRSHRLPWSRKQSDAKRDEQVRERGMAATATRTLQEMRDIVSNDMPQIYDRTAGEDDIREVLELETAMEMECERREMDARAMIRGANYMCDV